MFADYDFIIKIKITDFEIIEISFDDIMCKIVNDVCRASKSLKFTCQLNVCSVIYSFYIVYSYI